MLPPSSPLKEGGNYLPHISPVYRDFTGLSGFRLFLRVSLVSQGFAGFSGFRRKNSPPRLRGGVGEGQYGMIAEEIESFFA